MKRMWSKNELKNIANAQVQEQVSDGQLENVKVFEEITDKDGHKRFIEGEIELNESVTAISKTYGKWSLSGSHLLIVFCGSMENGAILTGGYISTINLPAWVVNKIYPLHSTTVVDQKVISFYGGTTQTVNGYLEKNSANKIVLYLGAVTANADKTFRMSYDLLIDNE